jgi:hypothetical protein
MRIKRQEMTEKAWVSRFWAEYSRLPETRKMGFFNLVQNLAREAGNQGQTKQLKIRPNPVYKHHKV